MKELKIRSLAMEGFKNQRERVEYDFSNYTIVTGDNGKGKTSIGEAIAWGFLGCNLWGNEKSDAKLVNEKCKVTEVEIHFTLGEEHYGLIRRRKGKSTDIYLNDIKINNEAIGRLIPDKKIFFTIFNPAYFSTLEPKDAKEFLLKIFGEIPKEQVLEAMDPYMRGLLLKNNFRNADLFLETQRQDMDDCEKDLIYLQGVMDSNEENTKLPERVFFDITELNKLQKELEEIQNRKPDLPDLSQLRERKAELEKQVFILENSKPALADTATIEKELIMLQAKASQMPIKEPVLVDVKSLEKRKDDLLQEYNSLKKEYLELKNETVECPNCGTQVNINDKEKARLKEKLEQVRQKGISCKSEIDEAMKKNKIALDEYNIIVEDYKAEIHSQIDDKKQQFNQAIIKNKGVEHEHLIKVQSDISKINEEITSLNIENFEEENRKALEKFNAEIAVKVTAIKEKIKEQTLKQLEVINHNASRDALEKQLEQMQEKARKAKDDISNTESKKNDIKVLIDCAKKFNAVKLELQTKKIDQYLDKVSIRLQKLVESTGELKDDFKIMYEGKEFNVLSTAERIKAGLEITNLIMNVTEIKYPVFIDNRESVTQYKKPDTQIIEAKVVEGQDLQIQLIA